MNMNETHDSESQSKDETEKCLDEFKRRFEIKIRDPKFALEVAGFLVLTLYAGLTGIQTYLTRTQFAEDQRAYVWVKFDHPVVFNRDWQLKPGTPPWSWDIFLVNYGKTPALNVVFCQEIIVGNAALTEYERLVAKDFPAGCDDSDTQAIPSVKPGVIPPGEKISATDTPRHPYDSRIYDPKFIDFIQSADDVIAIGGKIDYDDTSG